VDVDGDGDLDLAWMSLQRLRVLENVSPPAHFARVRLAATKSQRIALGAFVKVTAGGVTQQDYVRLTDGFQSQVPLDLHFGLGAASKIDRLEILWPSGARQSFADLPADRLLEFTEGEAQPRASVLPRWPEESRRRAKAAFSSDLPADRLEGGSGPLSVKGTPAVINFWSPTCGPCIKELPALAELARTFAGRAQFAGVSVETKDLDAVKAMVRQVAAGYPQFVGNDALLRSFFGPDGQAPLPSTFVFDASGALRRVFHRAIVASELSALLDTFGDEGTSAAELDRRGARLHELGRGEEAMDWLKKALAADPDRALTNYHYGLVLAGMGKKNEGVVYLRRSIELDPGYWSAHFNLAALLHNKGDFRGAVEHYQEALRLKGEDLDILLSLGSSAGAAESAPVGMDAFERAVKVAPRSPVAWGPKGQFHLALHQVAEARRCFEQALALDPNDATARAYMKDVERIEKEEKPK